MNLHRAPTRGVLPALALALLSLSLTAAVVPSAEGDSPALSAAADRSGPAAIGGPLLLHGADPTDPLDPAEPYVPFY